MVGGIIGSWEGSHLSHQKKYIRTNGDNIIVDNRQVNFNIIILETRVVYGLNKVFAISFNTVKELHYKRLI